MHAHYAWDCVQIDFCVPTGLMSASADGTALYWRIRGGVVVHHSLMRHPLGTRWLEAFLSKILFQCHMAIGCDHISLFSVQGLVGEGAKLCIIIKTFENICEDFFLIT